MMAPVSVVKQTAKNALKGDYLKTIIAALPVIFANLIILYSASVIGEFTSAAIEITLRAVCSFFIVCPLCFGTVRFFRRKTYGADDNVVGVFYYFSTGKRFFKSILLIICVFVRVIGPAIVAILPVVIAKVLQNGELYEKMGLDIPDFVSALPFVTTFFILGAAVSIFFLLIKYYLALYLFVSDDDMTIGEIIHMSKTIGRRNQGDFLVLLFSCVHYLILTALLIFAPFTVPVLFASYNVHCRFAVTEYNLAIKELSKEYTPTHTEGE